MCGVSLAGRKIMQVTAVPTAAGVARTVVSARRHNGASLASY